MEEVKLSKLTVKESDREYTKTIGKADNFTIRIPLPPQRVTIIALTARTLGGLDVNSFLAEDYNYTKMLVTLNQVIVNSPEWWNGTESCPDEELLLELWTFYIKSEEEFKSFLKKNNNKQPGK